MNKINKLHELFLIRILDIIAIWLTLVLFLNNI